MNKETYAFFLDIDGTVWENGFIPEVNKETVKRVRELGHKVFINTGRSFAYIPDSLFSQIEFDGVVSGMGASIRIGKDKILQLFLTKEDIRFIFDFFRGRDLWYKFEGEEKVIFYKENDPTGSDFFSDLPTARLLANEAEWDEKYLDEPITKVSLQSTDLDDGELALLRERFELVIHPSHNYMEIGGFGRNKATGMLETIERLGIDRAHCVAMGDSMNDFSMLEAAGISVAMADSEKKILDMADIVSISCKDGGVAYAMKKILGLKEKTVNN